MKLIRRRNRLLTLSFEGMQSLGRLNINLFFLVPLSLLLNPFLHALLFSHVEMSESWIFHYLFVHSCKFFFSFFLFFLLFMHLCRILWGIFLLNLFRTILAFFIFFLLFVFFLFFLCCFSFFLLCLFSFLSILFILICNFLECISSLAPLWWRLKTCKSCI